MCCVQTNALREGEVKRNDWGKTENKSLIMPDARNNHANNVQKRIKSQPDNKSVTWPTSADVRPTYVGVARWRRGGVVATSRIWPHTVHHVRSSRTNLPHSRRPRSAKRENRLAPLAIPSRRRDAPEKSPRSGKTSRRYPLSPC